jgi:hypothetical protein
VKWLFAALLTVVCWWERARLRLMRILCSVRATTLAFLEQVVGGLPTRPQRWGDRRAADRPGASRPRAQAGL